MRAAVMRGDRFVVEERPMPVPGPGDVLVKVRACGICGSDLHYFHHIDGMIENVRALGAPTDAMQKTLRDDPKPIAALNKESGFAQCRSLVVTVRRSLSVRPRR